MSLHDVFSKTRGGKEQTTWKHLRNDERKSLLHRGDNHCAVTHRYPYEYDLHSATVLILLEFSRDRKYDEIPVLVEIRLKLHEDINQRIGSETRS